MSGWRPVPASWVAVLISVWLSASGWSDWTLIPYFAVKSEKSSGHDLASRSAWR